MLIHGGDTVGYEARYGRPPLDFSANVSPLGLPNGVRSAVIAALNTADRYPDPLCRELISALSQAEGIPEQYILCGNGAADLIFRLVLAVNPKTALVLAPTFAEYEQALQLVNCQVQHHILYPQNDFTLTEAILGDITPELDMLFLCQPNNPTGQLCSGPVLHSILDACEANDVLLVADECFIEFLDRPADYSLHGQLSCNNLFILKAFTKLYAMAGLRLGYGLCNNTALLEKMRNCGQPWGVSSLAQAAGIAALQEGAYVERLRALIQEERQWLKAELTAMGCRVYGSFANFIFFESMPQLGGALEEKGVLIRSCANYHGLSVGYYRIGVRTRPDNERLVQAMKEVLL
ncbi:MAG: threonine-phosphate decarboxylase [Angelakisella sp.]